MSITREQVADLREGDVVELRWDAHPGVTVTGPLRPRGGGQWVGPVPVIGPNGEMHNGIDLTVISRAPRALYVNHERTEPEPGDVVRDADASEWNGWIYLRSDGDTWLDTSRGQWSGKGMPKRLRLLVDGETGRCVP